jgi:hypothetical protein
MAHEVLACKFRNPIDIERVRSIVFSIGRVLLAPEDIIGADVHKGAIELSTDLGELAHGKRVHPERLAGIVLALVDPMERRCVNDHMGLHLGKHVSSIDEITDIKIRMS